MDDSKSVSSIKSFMSIRSLQVSVNAFCWYYAGTNGWWKYEESSSDAIENAYLAYRNGEGPSKIMLPIAGNKYCIDFQNMHQCRVDNPKLRRKIIRDTPHLDNCKGVAGKRN